MHHHRKRSQVSEGDGVGVGATVAGAVGPGCDGVVGPWVVPGPPGAEEVASDGSEDESPSGSDEVSSLSSSDFPSSLPLSLSLDASLSSPWPLSDAEGARSGRMCPG